MEKSCNQNQSGMVTEQARLHAVPATETGRYPENEWKTETTRYSNDDGSGDAGVTPVGSRRLSEIRLIYCGCVGFGQILRSFSFNRPTIRLKRSKNLTQTDTTSPRSLISDSLLDPVSETTADQHSFGPPAPHNSLGQRFSKKARACWRSSSITRIRSMIISPLPSQDSEPCTGQKGDHLLERVSGERQ